MTFGFLLPLLAALGSGLVAGVFFAFSSFVMGALGRLPPAQGIAAMQSINVVVINRSFMALFLGTAAACAVVAGLSVVRWHAPGAALRLAGSLAFLLGAFAVTMVFNVPRNDALAAVRADSVEAAALWGQYLVEWTRWNSVRTVGALAGASLLTLGLLRR